MAETTGQPQQIGTCSTCGWPLREGCAHFCSTGSARIQQTFGVPVAAKDAEIAQLHSENEQWKTWGIIEIAVRNPNVSSYMEHWEGRATKAEAENAALREKVAALEKTNNS